MWSVDLLTVWFLLGLTQTCFVSAGYFDPLIVMYIFSPLSSLYIFFRWKYAYLMIFWNHNTTFYWGSLPSQASEQSCICVLNVSILPLFLVIFIHVQCIRFWNFLTAIFLYFILLLEVILCVENRIVIFFSTYLLYDQPLYKDFLFMIWTDFQFFKCLCY